MEITSTRFSSPCPNTVAGATSLTAFVFVCISEYTYPLSPTIVAVVTVVEAMVAVVVIVVVSAVAMMEMVVAMAVVARRS